MVGSPVFGSTATMHLVLQYPERRIQPLNSTLEWGRHIFSSCISEGMARCCFPGGDRTRLSRTIMLQHEWPVSYDSKSFTADEFGRKLYLLIQIKATGGGPHAAAAAVVLCLSFSIYMLVLFVSPRTRVPPPALSDLAASPENTSIGDLCVAYLRCIEAMDAAQRDYVVHVRQEPQGPQWQTQLRNRWALEAIREVNQLRSAVGTSEYMPAIQRILAVAESNPPRLIQAGAWPTTRARCAGV